MNFQEVQSVVDGFDQTSLFGQPPHQSDAAINQSAAVVTDFVSCLSLEIPFCIESEEMFLHPSDAKAEEISSFLFNFHPMLKNYAWLKD